MTKMFSFTICYQPGILIHAQSFLPAWVNCTCVIKWTFFNQARHYITVETKLFMHWYHGNGRLFIIAMRHFAETHIEELGVAWGWTGCHGDASDWVESGEYFNLSANVQLVCLVHLVWKLGRTGHFYTRFLQN